MKQMVRVKQVTAINWIQTKKPSSKNVPLNPSSNLWYISCSVQQMDEILPLSNPVGKKDGKNVLLLTHLLDSYSPFLQLSLLLTLFFYVVAGWLQVFTLSFATSL